MSGFKRINKSDIFTLPYVANKHWQFDSASLAANGILVYTGLKDDSVFDPENDETTNGEYQKLIYRSINHLFYQEFSGSFIDDTRKLQTNNFLSASIYRASGSYYDCNEWDVRSRYIPHDHGNTIKVLSIPKRLYGSSLKKGTFLISSSEYRIIDDEKGNLVDAQTSPETPVGNIFYSYGLAVVTSPDYQSIFDGFISQGDFSIDYADDFYN